MTTTDAPVRRTHWLRRGLRAVVPAAVLVAAAGGLYAGPASAGPNDSISGVITFDGVNKVRGAHVELVGTGLRSVTGSDGTYSITGAPSGGGILEVRAPCQKPAGAAVSINGATKKDIAIGVEFVSDTSGDYGCGPNGSTPRVMDNVINLFGDDAVRTVNLPFAFPFYGASYSAAHVSTNGYVSFSAPTSDFTNRALTDPGTPRAAIFPFWDDLVVDTTVDETSTVRTGLGPSGSVQAFTIEWHNVRLRSNPALPPMTFQLTLEGDGDFFIRYLDMGTTAVEQGSSATIGITDEAVAPGASHTVTSDRAAVSEGVGLQYRINRAPVPDAGPDQTVPSGSVVPLDGTESKDPDGNAMRFQWVQTAGPNTAIQGAGTQTPSVVAPTGPATLRYKLTTTDPFGKSASDTVTITVRAPK